jgi:GR25 family glycosyltransferase involved in LPS biosynthesis
MKVNDFFDKVYLINLKRRPDKLKMTKELLDKFNITFELFEAVDFCEGIPEDYQHQPVKESFLTKVKPGAFGCLMSHLEVIKDAKKNNYNKVLIFEDDLATGDNFEFLFSQKVKDLPSDWKLFYLGASGHTGVPKKKITDNISQTFESFTTGSYGVHSSLYDTILEEYKNPCRTIDQFYVRAIQSSFPCYVTSPTIMWQVPGFSDIAQAHRNYTGFMKNMI